MLFHFLVVLKASNLKYLWLFKHTSMMEKKGGEGAKRKTLFICWEREQTQLWSTFSIMKTKFFVLKGCLFDTQYSPLENFLKNRTHISLTYWSFRDDPNILYWRWNFPSLIQLNSVIFVRFLVMNNQSYNRLCSFYY